MKKIGIITWHYYNNFGSTLQSYALQTTIEKLGYKAEIINYRNKSFGQESIIKKTLKYSIARIIKLINGKFGERFLYPFLVFRKKQLNETKVIYDYDKLNKIADNYQTIICGSDQIWAPNVFNPIYMINFAEGKKIKKVSYAASVGLNYIPSKLQDTYKELLSDFYAISVREEVGMLLLKDKCEIDSTVVLDPTFLLDRYEYQKLQQPVKGIEQPFIFCYFLNKEHQYREQVEIYAKNKGYSIIGYSVKEDDSSWMTLLKKIGPSEFLWLVENSSIVFTDSYHGTIFSLIFNKKFWTFERFNLNDTINQNSRIYQLSKVFGIEQRILNDDSILEDSQSMDYNLFEEILKKEKNASINFLKEALE